jgi:hypothetical protein
LSVPVGSRIFTPMIKKSDIVIAPFQGFYVFFNKRIDFP